MPEKAIVTKEDTGETYIVSDIGIKTETIGDRKVFM